MKKKSLLIIIVAIVCLVFPISLWAKTSRTKTFTGINGQKIDVYGYEGDEEKDISVPAVPEHKIGDIIINENGEEEIVYAISEDGSFITVPPEMYYGALDALNLEAK